MEARSWRDNYSYLQFFYANVFFAGLSFSIVMPSIWLYLEKHGGTELFLAMTLLTSSFGELLGALVTGFLHDHLSTRTCLGLSLSLGTLGSVLYFSAEYVGGETALWIIQAARLLQGFWTGSQQAVEQAYISETAAEEDKLKILSELGISAVSGFLLGPVFGLLLSFVNIRVGFIVYDSFTCPGYIQTFLTCIMLYNTYAWFEEIPRTQREGRKENLTYRSPPDSVGLATSYLMLFCVFLSFATQETVTIPLITDVTHRHSNTFAGGIYEAYAVYGVSGLFSCLCFVFFHTTSGMFDNRRLAQGATALGVLGWVLMVDWQEREFNQVLFFLGFFLVRVSFIACRNVTMVILSNVIGPHSAGKYMGISLAVWGLARMVTPFLAIETLAVSTRLCFLSAAAVLLASVLLQFVCARHLLPHSDLFHRGQEEVVGGKALIDQTYQTTI